MSILNLKDLEKVVDPNGMDQFYPDQKEQQEMAEKSYKDRRIDPSNPSGNLIYSNGKNSIFGFDGIVTDGHTITDEDAQVIPPEVVDEVGQLSQEKVDYLVNLYIESQEENKINIPSVGTIDNSPTSTDLGRKFDTEKPDWSLLDMSLLNGTVDVLTFGLQKYERDNWKHVTDGHQRYYAAFMRHLNAHMSGEILDPESGKPHIDHAISCLLFMKHFATKE